MICSTATLMVLFYSYTHGFNLQLHSWFCSTATLMVLIYSYTHGFDLQLHSWFCSTATLMVLFYSYTHGFNFKHLHSFLNSHHIFTFSFFRLISNKARYNLLVVSIISSPQSKNALFDFL